MTAVASPDRGLRVAEVARAAGVAPDTIRYYERAGLLPPPPRSASGYRAYEPSAVDRLKFVQGAQRLGLRLRDIADLLAVRDTGVCPCEPAEQLLRRRLGELDAEMGRLAALREQMVTMVEALPSADCPPPSPGTWCPARREREVIRHDRAEFVVPVRPRMHRSELPLRLLVDDVVDHPAHIRMATTRRVNDGGPLRGPYAAGRR